jgi:type III pantothenate kinase
MVEQVLIVDLGNSRLKWTLSSRGNLGSSQALSWREAELPALLDKHWAALERPASVVASVVAPVPVAVQLERWVKKRWDLPLRLLAPSVSARGVTCGYRDPTQLGADRWAALIAAHARYPRGALVVDCGTATTLDALAAGRHLGGYILPGVVAMQEAVQRNTAIERSTGRGSWDEAWGRSTAACIELGAVRALVTLIEHSLERLQVAGVCDPALVVTGGQAGLILPAVQVDYRRHDDLVLEGIMHCFRERLQ